MLLAYYELTNEERVLKAVEKAMAVTMKHYNKGSRNPFDLKNAFGGGTHGLMMTDVCETLHRITGLKAYQDYATYLYRAYSTFDVNRAFNDVRYPFLIERNEAFSAHGVHTYEHLRSLLSVYYATDYDELETAFENAMYKLESCMLPSGVGHGELYYQRSPLVYALNIPSRQENIKEYSLDGFYDYYCYPKNKDYENLSIAKNSMHFEYLDGKKPRLKGQLMDINTKKLLEVELIPMCETILRRVTFPLAE